MKPTIREALYAAFKEVYENPADLINRQVTIRREVARIKKMVLRQLSDEEIEAIHGRVRSQLYIIHIASTYPEVYRILTTEGVQLAPNSLKAQIGVIEDILYDYNDNFVYLPSGIIHQLHNMLLLLNDTSARWKRKSQS